MEEVNKKLNWFEMMKKIHQDSLDANRQGKFSTFQQELLKLRLNDLKWFQGLVVIGAMIFAVILTSSVITPLFGLSSESSTLVMILLVIVAAVGSVAWLKSRVRARLQKIVTGTIESDLGQYRFEDRKKNYGASCGKYALQPLFAINLLPGPYRFYYLKKPAVLLSAEPCDPKSVPSYNPDTDSLDATLQRTLGFDGRDLAANREGQLSDRQKSKLRRKIRKGKETICYVFGHGSRKPYGEVSTGAAALELAMNFLGPLPNAVYYFAKTISPAEKHVYFIDQHQFLVPATAWMALVEGLFYKAYFLEGTNQMLSLEVVTE
jgi:hypothetical protein